MLSLPSVGIRTTTTAWTRERECPVRPLQAATYALAVLCTGCAGHSPRSYRGIAALQFYHTLSGQHIPSVQLHCAHNICSLRFLLALTKTGVGRYSALQGLVSLDFVHPRYNVPFRGTPLTNASQSGTILISTLRRRSQLNRDGLCLFPRLGGQGAGRAFPWVPLLRVAVFKASPISTSLASGF